MPEFIFISYAKPDEPRARELCTVLRRMGVNYRIAPDSIPPGERYGIAIDKAIHSWAVFLVLFSRAADVSDAVGNEVELATDYKKKIVPLRLGQVEPKNLRYYLKARQWLNWPCGAEQLREALGVLAQAKPDGSISATRTAAQAIQHVKPAAIAQLWQPNFEWSHEGSPAEGGASRINASATSLCERAGLIEARALGVLVSRVGRIGPA